MSSSLSLFRLQQVDSQLDKVQARLDEIQQILANDKEVQKARSLVSNTKKENESAKLALRQSEANVKEQQLKIEQSEASLYGGKVKNPKELQDLQNEAASLKKHLSTLEDRQLEAMVTAEDTEKAYGEAQSGLALIEEQRLSQNKELTEEMAGLQKDIERLNSERKAASSVLPDNLLQQYMQIREERNGLAVAAIEDGSCSACGGTVTNAQLQAARSANQTANCAICKRFIYPG